MGQRSFRIWGFRFLRSIGPGALAELAQLLLVALLLPGLAGAESQDKTQRKALVKQSKALIREAKGLEVLGQLREARARFAESQAFWDSKEAAAGIKGLDQIIRKRTGTALKQAHSLYNQGKFKEAAATLEGAANLGTMNFGIALDLALCYQKLGDITAAIESLDQATAAATEPKRRTQLAQWRTELITGENGVHLNARTREQLERINQSLLAVGTERNSIVEGMPEFQERPDADHLQSTQTTPNSAEGSNSPDLSFRRGKLCESLEALGPESRTPSVIYDLANCSQNNNQPARAADLLKRYLELAPGAADSARVQVRIKDLQTIADLAGANGNQIRSSYASAFEYVQERRYGSALASLERALVVAPDFPPTHWRLALLEESLGRVDQARKHFSTFLEIETSPEARAEAKLHLDTLNAKRDKYEAEVGAAEEIVSDLLNRAMNLTFNGLDDRSALYKWTSQSRKARYEKKAKWVGGFGVPYAYAQQQLATAQEHLSLATSVMPLGPEANELLGFVMLQAGDGGSAMKAFDAVKSQDLPVAFYGEMRGHKQDRPVKCELSETGIQVIYLASYGKNGKPIPPAKPAGSDGLGDLITDCRPSGEREAESSLFTSRDIKRVETKNGHLVLKLANEEIALSPICLPSAAPTDGPPARRFANLYTRLFVRYAGLETSRLGNEGLTGYEKVKLGYHLANSGLNLAMSMSPMGAIGASQALYDITKEIHGVAQSLHVSYASWIRSVQDQGVAQGGEPFKIIPTEPPSWTFVENTN